MRTWILAAAIGVAALVAATEAAPAVDCNRVNRELKLGRWPEDVALGMGITLADVNRCKDAPVTSQPRPATSPKPVTNRKSSATRSEPRGSASATPN